MVGRLFRHLSARDARRMFPTTDMARIAGAIAEGERRHRGEVCFAVESSLHWRDVLRGVQPRMRAEEAFARLRVWDTAGNNGVLIYLLLADRRIEIVADRGLHGTGQRSAMARGVRSCCKKACVRAMAPLR